LKLFFGQIFFWVHIVTKIRLHFLKLHKISNLLIPISTHYEKNCGSYRVTFSYFWAQKNSFPHNEVMKIKKTLFFILMLEFVCWIGIRNFFLSQNGLIFILILFVIHSMNYEECMLIPVFWEALATGASQLLFLKKF
jgi:hypothetical protein